MLSVLHGLCGSVRILDKLYKPCSDIGDHGTKRIEYRDSVRIRDAFRGEELFHSPPEGASLRECDQFLCLQYFLCRQVFFRAAANQHHLSFSGHQPEGAAQQLLLERFRGYRRWSSEPPFDDLLQRADDELGEKFGIG